jgi:hypothetical protein
MFRTIFDWVFVGACIGLCLFLAYKGSYELWNAFFYNRGDEHFIPAFGEIVAACVSLKFADRVVLSTAFGR